MRCSNCGWEGPYHGRICPACGADKSRDKSIHAISVLVGLVAGGACALVGLAMNNAGVALIGFFITFPLAFALTRFAITQPRTAIALVLIAAGVGLWIWQNPETVRGWLNQATQAEQPAKTSLQTAGSTPTKTASATR